jgi:signal recognition particle receptor subunit beta
MAVFNYAGGEINAKIVYYGPGLSGKTTNLECIYSKLPRENKGKMVSMKTRTDRTLFFDFLPVDVGDINGMKVRFLLYTVPGQVYYNATRKLVLKGVDALVFVADSASDRMQDNKESLQNLEDNLNDLGMTLKEIPWVIQFNKRDLPNRLDSEVMARELNVGSVPHFEASASNGSGVYETLEGIAKLVFKNMVEDLRDPDRAVESRDQHKGEHLSVEVVAKSANERNSETDESDYRCNAVQREEEHESVSEFVETVLTEENASGEGVNLGATREGYEDYGHIVDLNGGEPEAKKEAGEKAGAAGRETGRTKPASSNEKATTTRAPSSRGVVEERTIRVPIHISRDDVGKEIQLSVVLEIDVR